MASASAVPTASTAPNSKPNGIPDIMRGIGNMLRIAILEYNYKASLNELTTVLNQISGLNSRNANLGADVNRLTGELKNANIAQTRNFNILNADYTSRLRNANTGFREQLQDFQNRNAQLEQQLQDTQQRMAALAQQNGNLQNELAALEQTLTQVRQQIQQQIQQLQAETATANQARAAAEARATAAQNAAQAAAQQALLVEGRQQIAIATATAKLRDANTRIQQLNHQLGNRSTLNQQQVADLQVRLQEATSEKRQLEARLTHEQDAARQQIAAAQQAAIEANAQAVESAAEVRDLQNQLTDQKGLSQQQVDDLTRRLEEAQRNATAAKEEVKAATEELQQQLDQQMQDAQAAAQQAAEQQQELTTQLAELQQRVGTTEQGNAGLQARIAQIREELAAANENAQKTQQDAAQAKKQFDEELAKVQATAAAQVAEAHQSVEDLQARLDEATRTGTITREQLAAFQQQKEAAKAAAEEAETARQDAAQWAEEAERASKELTQQKYVSAKSAIKSAIFKKKANTAAEAAAKAQQEAEEAKKQLAQQQAAAEAAAETRAAAEERATQQQSELDALRQQLETAKRNGEDVDALKQTLSAKETEVNKTKNELEAQKLAAEKEKADLEEKNKAIKAEVDEIKTAKQNASNEAANALNEANAAKKQNKELADELNRLQQQIAELQSERDAASKVQKDQDDAKTRQKDAEFSATIATLRERIAGAKASIAKMTDQNCKAMLTKQVEELEKLFISLNKHDNITNFKKLVEDLSEATGDKIKTFVSMRKEENPRSITFDKTKKKITIAGGGPLLREWGPFSGVFDPESNNEAKYKEMKAGLLDDIPTKGTTVVIFGYGYSGSGKTYTLLGGINNETNKWEDGIAQLAIQEYLKKKYTVEMEEVFEMYNDSYTFDNKSQKFVYNQSTSHNQHTFDFKPVKLERLEDINIFKTKYSEIQRKRIKHSHILPTPNNRESSRGHLFIVLKVTNGNTEGRLIICDMGGRENPNEMWMTAQYCKGPKQGSVVHVILGPVSKTNSSKYYKYNTEQPTESTEVAIPKGSTIVPAAKAVIGDNAPVNASLKFGINSNGSGPESIIRNTLKQGFYINDSINEMLAEFGYNFKSKEAYSNWYNDYNDKNVMVYKYNPDVRALSVASKIGIHELFQDFREKSNCKIKFCTVACIRSPEIFYNDTIKTLEFARDVNSVILAAPPAPISAATAAPPADSAPSSLPAADSAPSSLPAAAAVADSAPSSLPAADSAPSSPPAPISAATAAAAKDNLGAHGVVLPHAKTWEKLPLFKQPPINSGGSIRRHRRKKHAIFKTLKKSRLGFSDSASASDSASNSVKVKHKTRNKKKHNTRNNTVKK